MALLPGQKLPICQKCGKEVTRERIELAGGLNQGDEGPKGLRRLCNWCGEGIGWISDPIGDPEAFRMPPEFQESISDPIVAKVGKSATKVPPSIKKLGASSASEGPVTAPVSTRDRVKQLRREIKDLDQEIKRLDRLREYREQLSRMLRAAEQIQAEEKPKKHLRAISA